jgi:hypothetical protein
MAKKNVDPLKAKQKKQKILAAGLAVAFLGLLAFQVPRVMKRMHPAAPPSVSGHTSTTSAPPAGTPSLAAPTLSGAEQSPSTTTADPGVLASSGTPTVQDGQLASFSRFASKDPFSQQLSDDKTGSGTSSSSGSSSEPGVPAIPGNEPAPGSAVISVNGTLYTVPTGTDFPQASTTDASQASTTDPTLVPLFHLVSLTAHTARISIVGGSYTNGSRTVLLKERKSVTLMNTADGTRYKLMLMPLGTEVPVPGSSGSSSGTSTTPTTVTLPPATP